MRHTLAFKVVAKQLLQLGAEGTKQAPGASEASTLAAVGGGLGFLACHLYHGFGRCCSSRACSIAVQGAMGRTGRGVLCDLTRGAETAQHARREQLESESHTACAPQSVLYVFWSGLSKAFVKN